VLWWTTEVIRFLSLSKLIALWWHLTLLAAYKVCDPLTHHLFANVTNNIITELTRAWHSTSAHLVRREREISGMHTRFHRRQVDRFDSQTPVIGSPCRWPVSRVHLTSSLQDHTTSSVKAGKTSEEHDGCTMSYNHRCRLLIFAESDSRVKTLWTRLWVQF